MASQNGNEILYPLENYNFMLRVEGAFDLPCKSVHSFTREREYEYIQEGGQNDYVHMKRKPISKPYTFTVERYVAVDPLAYDPLQEGTELVLPVMLFVSRFPGRFDVTRRVYTFTGCTVISKEYGELNAEQPGLLVEKAVIAYRELLNVTTLSDKDIGKWSIKEPDKQRKATKNYSRDFEVDDYGNATGDRVREWTISRDNPKGAGIKSAKTFNKPEDGAEQENSYARKWEADDGASGKKSVRSAMTKEFIQKMQDAHRNGK